MKNILVTGGAGYIGSHTCKLLANSGYNPIAYDNLSTGHKEFVKWGDLVVGELHDTKKLVETLDKYAPDAVIHFAASAYVGESVVNPFKYYKNNVGGTLSLLEAMISCNVRALVFSSTCATYGTPDTVAIDESTPQNPINPYGRSKLMIENILQDLSMSNELRSVALRYFNAAGADADAEIGEWHEPETHLIPLAIKSATGGNALKVFGNDFSTPDGTAIRDYIHVEDLARAHLKAVEYLLSHKETVQVNLGMGQGVSVRGVIEALDSIGVKAIYEIASKREGDPACLVANNLKAKELLNWEPKYKTIRDVLISAVNWHVNHLVKN